MVNVKALNLLPSVIQLSRGKKGTLTVCILSLETTGVDGKRILPHTKSAMFEGY
jgi:hypothetical protein